MESGPGMRRILLSEWTGERTEPHSRLRVFRELASHGGHAMSRASLALTAAVLLALPAAAAAVREPFVDPAIPAGEDGIFAGVTSIQRVNTSGGVAPATGCSADAAGAEARVAFTADFYFYKRRGA